MDQRLTSTGLSLDQVLGQHQGMIQAYAYAITRDFHLAEDVRQDVALFAAGQQGAMPAGGEDLVCWLKGVTRRKSLEALRRFHSRRMVLAPAVLDRIATAISPEPDDERYGRVVAGCLEKLSGHARTVVESRYWRSMTCGDIAAELGRSVKSVYGILCRSRILLEACIERGLKGRA